MSIELIVNGKSFNYPQQGDDPVWGSDATAWASEVTEVLSDINTAGDILQTAFTIANNQSLSTNVNGLLLDTGTVRGATVEYTVYRISTSNPSGHAEKGMIHAIYDDNAGSGSKWLISMEKAGNSGVTLDIDDTGQFTYTSTDIGSLGYSGTMRFKSKSLSQ